jgi:hypothetical protein
MFFIIFVVGINLRLSNLKGEPQPIFPRANFKNQRLIWLRKISLETEDNPLSASQRQAG